MSIEADVLFLPTKKFKQDKSKSKLENLSNRVEDNWNNEIEYEGDFGLSTEVWWGTEIDLLPIDRRDPFEARDAAADRIANKYSYLFDWFDAIHVRDAYTHSTTANGAAKIGHMPWGVNWKTGGQAAGGGDKSIVSYTGNHQSSHLEDHEVAHSFGGLHEDHGTYGWAQFTIMGNPGQDNCGGGTTHRYRERTDTYNSTDTCTIARIRAYMRRWASENGSFDGR